MQGVTKRHMDSTASACRDEISPDQAGGAQDEDKDDAAEPDPPPPVAGNVAPEDSVELAERPEDLSGESWRIPNQNSR